MTICKYIHDYEKRRLLKKINSAPKLEKKNTKEQYAAFKKVWLAMFLFSNIHWYNMKTITF